MDNMTLSDIAAVTNGGAGFGGGSWIWVILFIALLTGGFGNRGDYREYATAASQQEILFGQRFQDLDNKMDRLGNGIADATFALNNTINGVQTNLGGAIVTEGRGISDKLCGIDRAIHEEGERTRNLMQENKIEELQRKIAGLEMDAKLCGIVRYPMATTYTSGGNPFCGCGCGCGNNF